MVEWSSRYEKVARVFLLSLLVVGLFRFISTNCCVVSAVTDDSSGIPKPSVPEFIIEFDNESRDIILEIKNQPFVSYYDVDRGFTLNLYYNVRFKKSGDWTEIYRPSAGFLHQNSGSEYTIQSFGTTIHMDGKIISIPSGEVDFQVEAMIGLVHRQVMGGMAPWVFSGEKSGWSESQTITVQARAPSTSEEPKPEEPETPVEPEQPEKPETPTESEERITHEEEQYQLEELAVILGTVSTVLSVAALGTGLMVYFKIQKTLNKKEET